MRTPIGFNPLDRAVGDDAENLRRVTQAAAVDDNTITIGHRYYELVRAVRRALTEAADEGTTTYPLAVALALRFLSTLPPGIPLPEIVVDSYGDIALDWDYGPRRITSVRVSTDGVLYYASLLGHATAHGSETYSEMIPRSIIGAIRRVVEPNYR